MLQTKAERREAQHKALVRKTLHQLRKQLRGIIANSTAELQKENDLLRNLLAKSPLPCVYCGLAREDMGKCKSGFPGCGRADDILTDLEIVQE